MGIPTKLCDCDDWVPVYVPLYVVISYLKHGGDLGNVSFGRVTERSNRISSLGKFEGLVKRNT